LYIVFKMALALAIMALAPGTKAYAETNNEIQLN
jgi:hypothetical protein